MNQKQRRMEIISPGNAGKKQFTCKDCNTTVVADEKDANYFKGIRMVRWVKCPKCGAPIIDEEHYREQGSKELARDEDDLRYKIKNEWKWPWAKN